MDQISVQYMHVASDARSQIADPDSVVAFVSRMQSMLAKSSAPRKNFLLDSTTPHGDVVITEAAAMKPRNGWATLQVTEGIRRGVHEWCVKVENQGESTDGSGLMVGIVPKNYNKFDSFISQGGGWCLSRAGKLYGHWRRQEANVSTISFGTGDRVVLLFDYDHARLTVRVGKNYMVGELSNLATEVFPAISLYYRQQHVRFEYHVVHDRKEQPLGWMTRQVLPVAAAFLPLSEDQLAHMTLDSYIFSTLFDDKAAATAEAGVWPGTDDDGGGGGGDAPAALTYTSLRAALARCTVLTQAFAALRRCGVEAPRRSTFLEPALTAEYLRRRHCEAVRARAMNHGGQDGAGGGAYGGGGASNGMYSTQPAYDAALNCGAVMVVHLFTRVMEAARDDGGASQTLLTSLIQQLRHYLEALPLFDLAECDPRAGRQPCSALAPEVLQLALDHIMARLTALSSESPLSACDAALMELMLVLVLQRGCVSEVLRGCRLLLRFPAETASVSLAAWLRCHVHALRPPREVPDLAPLLTAAAATGATATGARDLLTALPLPPSLSALPSVFSVTSLAPSASGGGAEAGAEDEAGAAEERLTLSLPSTLSVTVLAVGYANEFVYLQTQEGLGRWGHDGRRFVRVHFTQEPTSCCPAASYASVAASATAVLLLTDRMRGEGVAVVAYNTALEVVRVHRLDGMPAAWPRLRGTGSSGPQQQQLLTTGPGDTVILLTETQDTDVEGGDCSDGDDSTPAAGVPWSDGQTARRGVAVEMCCFTMTAAPALLWRRPLCLPRGHTPDLTHCLLLRRPGLVDLGNPADLLRVIGGRVTVELWVTLLAKDDTATLYQHGDKSATGEVFLETTRLERCVFVRGGYRHDTRGACVVSAPLPPAAEGGFFHVALVFDGRWHLFLDGSEAQAGPRQGAHVALDCPTQRWTVGGNCTCLLAGLRVWTVARGWREVARDCRRLVAMNEPGLVCQLLFNERGGNVVFNYVAAARPRHGVCAGAYARVRCDQHPWRAATLPFMRSHNYYDATAANAMMGNATATRIPAAAERSFECDDLAAFPLLHDWHKLARAHCFCTGTHLVLVSCVPPAATSAPAPEVVIADDGETDAAAVVVGNGAAPPVVTTSQAPTLFPVKKGGKVLCFFDLQSGVLYPAMYYLDAGCVKADLFACDTRSFLIDIHEGSSMGAKGDAETDVTEAEAKHSEKVMLVNRLALRSHAVTTLAASPSSSWRAADTMATAVDTTYASSAPEESGSPRACRVAESPAWLTRSGATPQPFPYRGLAVWLLQTLSLHATSDNGAPTTPVPAPADSASHLFVPLADDVGLRCVTEVKAALQEHFRVVKGPNARRALSVRDGSSLQVLMTALQVLLRLIYRVRDFALHPASVGLSVLHATRSTASMAVTPISPSLPHETTRSITHDACTEKSSASSNNASSARRRTSCASQDFYTVICDLLPRAAARAHEHESSLAQSPTLDEDGPAEAILSMLGDLINEAEPTFASAALGRLARVVLSEGIDLFLPDVRCRAAVLRNALAPHRSERGAALQVFLHAIVRSLSSPMQLIGLLPPPPTSPTDAAADTRPRSKSSAVNNTSCASIDRPHEERPAALDELCATADALLRESVRELQRAAVWGDGRRDMDGATQTLTSLANTLGAAQLTLLSACQSSSSLPSADTSATALDRQCIRRYYNSLFHATSAALKCIVEGARGNAGANSNGGGGDSSGKSGNKSSTTTSSPARVYRTSPSSKPRDLQNVSLPPIAPASGVVARGQRTATSNTTPTTTMPAATTMAEASTLGYLVQHSFLSSVLHAALGALPLLFDVEQAPWFLQQLDKLLTLADTLRHRLRATPDDVAEALLSPTSTGRVACERLYCALYFAAMWIAVHMSCWAPTVAVQGAASGTNPDEDATRRAARGEGVVPPDEGTVPPPSDLSFFCESGFVVGGLREETGVAEGGVDGATGHRAGRKATTGAPVLSRLAAIQRAIDADEAYWLRLQQRLDALGPRVTSTMARLLVRLAAAALYLGSTPALERLPVKELQIKIAAVVRRLVPVRNELLQDARTRRADDFAAQLDELQARCDVLMRLVHATEAARVLSSSRTSLAPAPARTTVQTVGHADVTHDDLPELTLGVPCWRYALLDAGGAPHSPRRRWRWAVNAVQRWRRLHYASALANTALDLDASVAFVSRVARSSTLSAVAMTTACASRAALARTRLQGLRQLLRLLHQAPALAEDVALLMRHESEKAAVHYADGLNGCGAGLLLQLRCTMYDLLHWLALHHPRGQGSTAATAGVSGQADATHTEGSDDSSVPAMALCAAVHREWKPCDLDVLRRLGVVAALFRATGTIFATHGTACSTSSREPATLPSTEAAAAPPVPLLLRTSRDAATLQEHESVVAQYQQRTRLRAAAGARAAMASGSAGGEDVEATTPVLHRTATERVQCMMWECLKSLALQCARQYSAGAAHTLLDRLACSAFLQDYFTVFHNELCACMCYSAGDAGAGDVQNGVRRVRQQVQMICSLLSILTAQLGRSPVTFDRGLATSAARLARLLCAFVETDPGTAAAQSGLALSPTVQAACIRTAAQLLAPCPPSHTYTHFAPDDGTTTMSCTVRQLSDAAQTQKKSIRGATSPTLGYFLSLAVRRLLSVGQDEVVIHTVLALRTILLSRAAWAAELTSLAGRFRADLDHMALDTTSAELRRANGARLYICVAALGGWLYCSPVPGLPVHYVTSSALGSPAPQAISAVASTDTDEAKEGQGIVLALSGEGEEAGQEETDVVALASLGATQSEQGDVVWNVDDGDVHTDADHISLPFSVSREEVWPYAVHAPHYTRLVADFVAPALMQFTELLPTRGAHLSAVELAALASLLSLTARLVATDARQCAALVELRCIARLNQCALTLLARLPLSRPHLNDLAACTLTSLLRRQAQGSVPAGVGARVASVSAEAATAADDHPGAPLTAAPPQRETVVDVARGVLPGLGAVTSGVLPPPRSTTSAPGSPRPALFAGRGLGVMNLALAYDVNAIGGGAGGAAVGYGFERLAQSFAMPLTMSSRFAASKVTSLVDTPLTPMLCFHVLPDGAEPRAGLRVTPLQKPGHNNNSSSSGPGGVFGRTGESGREQGAMVATAFPCWSDGMAVEVAVLLCDQLYPELGEAVCMPSTWGQPGLRFPLLSLYADSAEVALLQLRIEDASLVCILHLGAGPDKDAADELCRLELAAEDWDHFLYISVVMDHSSVLLTKGSESVSVALPPRTATQLEATLSRAGAVTRLVLGHDVDRTADPHAEPEATLPLESATLVLVSGLRMWGSCVLKSSLRNIADFVKRNQSLHPFNPCEDTCFFCFTEGTGRAVQSIDGAYCGVLQGAVRWAFSPCPMDTRLELDRKDRLLTGLPPTVAAGSPSSGAAPFLLPRGELIAFLSALDEVGVERLCTDLLLSLVAHWTRKVTLEALQQCLGPGYALLQASHTSPADRASPTFDPWQILEKKDTARQLVNLLRYSDTGVLRTAHVRLLDQVVTQLLRHCASRGDTGALVRFVSDTLDALCAVLPHGAEVIDTELPYPVRAVKGVHGPDAVLPLQLTNGGGGILVFNPRLPNQEQLAVFKDAAQKNTMMKYPDSQDGLPDCRIPPDTAWFYVRLFSVQASTGVVGASRGRGAATVALSVSLRSLHAAVLHAIFLPLCAALLRHGDGRYACCVPVLLRGRVVATLALHAASDRNWENCLHAAGMLTALLEVWRGHPRVQPYDQVPLRVLLSHYNFPLMSELWRDVVAQETSAPRSLVTGTYNCYTQILFGLLTTAVRTECAWRGCGFAALVCARWNQLLRCWRACALPAARRQNDGAALLSSSSLSPVVPPTAVDAAAAVVTCRSGGVTRAVVPAAIATVRIARRGSVATSTSHETAASPRRLRTATAVVPLAESTSSTHFAPSTPHAVVGLDVLTASQPAHGPTVTARQRGSGRWALRCDRDSATVRGSVGLTRGRFYFEVYVTDSSCNLVVGITTSATWASEMTGDALGQDAESWGFSSSRLCRFHQGYRNDFTSRAKWKVGDVVGILIDLELNRLCCLHNGVQVSIFEKFALNSGGNNKGTRNGDGCFAGSGGTSNGGESTAQEQPPTMYFPAVTFGAAGCEVNFGAAPFLRSFPLSFLPVDPAHCITHGARRAWYLVQIAELSTQLVATERRLAWQGGQERDDDDDSSSDERAGDVRALSAAGAKPVLSGPLELIQRRVQTYCVGRRGPLTVSLLCSSPRAKLTTQSVSVEDGPCVVRGGVAVYSGRWYYEVVTGKEAGLHVGWVVAEVDDGEWGLGKNLGDDAYSWALEGKRMIARHRKHQLNLARHTWKEGDVVGCMIDCDAGTMSFSINGVLQREVHKSDGDGVLFRDLVSRDEAAPGEAGVGFAPAVGLDAKAEATFMWCAEDMLFLPEGYKALGATGAVTDALVDALLHPAQPPAPVPQGRQEHLVNLLHDVQHLAQHVNKTVELTMGGLASYTLRGFYRDVAGERGQTSQPASTPPRPVLDPAHEGQLVLLQLVSTAAEHLFPFAHLGAAPSDVEDLHDFVRGAPLLASLDALRRYCLPFAGLRPLAHFLQVGAAAAGGNLTGPPLGGGENIKLSINRRRALATLRDKDASAQSRLQSSLFGQVYQLLANKGSALFCTSKKMWSVAFFGEGADDVGGPYREALTQICRELMSTDLPLFIPSANQAGEMGESREVFVPNPRLAPPLQLQMYRFIGRLMAGCLRTAEPLALYLSSRVWKALVGASPVMSDLERVDSATAQALRYLRQRIARRAHLSTPDATDEELDLLCPGGFTVRDDAGVEHELVRDGRRVRVRRDNVQCYVQLYTDYVLRRMAAPQLCALAEGFHEVVPLYSVSELRWFELEELVCGPRDYDPDALLDAARYENLDRDDSRVRYLRQVLRGFTRAQRAAFMRFVSGRERLPPHMRLRLMPDDACPPPRSQPSTAPPLTNTATPPSVPQNTPTPPPQQTPRGEAVSTSATPSRENITVPVTSPPAARPSSTLLSSNTEQVRVVLEAGYDDARLPHASTCFYWLSLPRYSSAHVLRERLLFAIEHCLDIDADFRVRDQDNDAQDENVPVLARANGPTDDEFEDYSSLR